MNKGLATALRSATRFGILGVACLAIMGCGAETGELSGTVTYNSKPVRMGTVTVAAADGSIQTGTINTDGTYTVTGIPIGPAKISVGSPDPKSTKVAQRKKEEPPPKPDTTNWMAIPSKYGDAKDSGLTTEIKSGKNAFPIELK